MSKTIRVKPGSSLEENEIAIWERDDAHPTGEIYLVQGDGPIEVALTVRIEERLADARLERVATAEGG